MYDVILYYHFHAIEDVERFCVDHKKKCLERNLLGRVYIAREGINGTLAGTPQDIAGYKDYLKALPGFEGTEFKDDRSEFIPFRKLTVKVRPELVTLKAKEDIDLTREKGKRLTPGEWRRTLETDEACVVIDTRNRYEWAIGHFEGALLPDVENFYDFPKWIEEAGIARDQKILMYCTGGIRCEKFSVLMEKRGYNEVYQLHGGIVQYGKEEGGAHFKGKCFVFDDRLAVPIGRDCAGPIARCVVTGAPCDTYINCANPDCNKLFICSQEGARSLRGCCSQACMDSPRRRPLDPQNVFAPTRKWYAYFDKKI